MEKQKNILSPIDIFHNVPLSLPRETYHPVDQLVGSRLRSLRLMQGISIKTMANQWGTRYQQFQKYESGENRLTCSRLFEFARFFGVSVDFFFEDVEEFILSESETSKPICGKVSTSLTSNAALLKKRANRKTQELVRLFNRIEQIDRKRILALMLAIVG